MSNGKDVIIHLIIVGLIKTKLNEILTSQYFPKPYESCGGNINVKVVSSDYATKTELKNATGTDKYKLVSKSDLASLNAEVDKVNIVKLVPVPVDLSKLSDVVKNIDKYLKKY